MLTPSILHLAVSVLQLRKLQRTVGYRKITSSKRIIWVCHYNNKLKKCRTPKLRKSASTDATHESAQSRRMAGNQSDCPSTTPTDKQVNEVYT